MLQLLVMSKPLGDGPVWVDGLGDVVGVEVELAVVRLTRSARAVRARLVPGSRFIMRALMSITPLASPMRRQQQQQQLEIYKQTSQNSSA